MYCCSATSVWCFYLLYCDIKFPYFGTIIYHKCFFCLFRFWWSYHSTIRTKLLYMWWWSCVFTNRWRITAFCSSRGCCSFMWPCLPSPLLVAQHNWRAAHRSTMFYMCQWLVLNVSCLFSQIFGSLFLTYS